MELLLGIDLGSTSIKAILYDVCGKVVASGTRPMQRFHPNPEHPEWTVWDPEVLWNETAHACRNAMSQIADPHSVKGIATTGMGMDGLPMGEGGERLYPLISWHDPRTQPQYEWWLKNITAEKSYAIGGNPVWAINSALRMRWLQENEPTIFRNTYKWLLIEDYINHCLCGVFATDFSMASCTMLFDQQKQCWSEEMCQQAEIPASILPNASLSATRLGEVHADAARQTGLAIGTPVFLGGHDHICSSLPVGAFHPGTVLNITGTWEMIDLVASEPPLDKPLGKSGITVQSHVVPHGYMVWCGNPAGEMLEWYRRSFPQTSNEGSDTAPLDWARVIDQAMASPPGSGGLLFLPHLGGASSPHVDPRSRGAFVGLHTRTTQADIVRSLFEGLGFQLLDILATMESGTRTKPSEIIAVGGAIRNTFWMQNKADMLGLPVRVPQVEEATALGAAILAGIGTGLYADAEDAFAHIDCPSEVYTPDLQQTDLYTDLFAIYRDVYAALAPIHHRLFDRFA